ncbi:MAG TPA: hypothetical protein PKY81_13535 [bacterium]|nr:hypothetical protein [bacterium]
MSFFKQYRQTPKFLILPGSLYLNDFNLITEPNWKNLNKTRRYLGENYAVFRIGNNFENGYFFRPLAYSKLPCAIIQFFDYCEIIEFPDNANLNLLSAGFRYDNPGISIKIGYYKFEIKCKSKLHLGEWERNIELDPNKTLDSHNASIMPEISEKIDAKKNLKSEDFKILKYEKWYDYTNKLIKTCGEVSGHIILEETEIIDSIKLSAEFSGKIYDSKNEIHCEFIEPDNPSFELNRELYCLPTYEFGRLYYLSLIYPEKIPEYFLTIKNILKKIIVDLPELDCSVTHNTIGIDDYNGIYAHTQFNTGLAGYPGGIASDLIYILLFCRKNNFSNDNEIINQCAKLIRWLEYARNSDKTFSYTIPSVPAKEELFYKCETGEKNITTGGTSAAAYAFCLWAEITGEKKYFAAAKESIESVLPSKKFFNFNFYGFLRDGGAFENDGVSAYYTIKTLVELNARGYDYSSELSKIGGYIFQWVYNRKDYSEEISGFADPMTDSFSPRLAVWDTVLWSEMYLDLYKNSGCENYLILSKLCFKKAIGFQNKRTGGIPESVGINFNGSLIPVNLNNGVSLWIIGTGIELLNTLYKKKITYLSIDPSCANIDNNIVEIKYGLLKEKFDRKFLLKIIMRNFPLKPKRFIKKVLRGFVNYESLRPVKKSGNGSVTAEKKNYSNLQKEYGDLKFSNFTHSELKIDRQSFEINIKIKSEYYKISELFCPVIRWKDCENIYVEKKSLIGNLIKQLTLCVDGKKFFEIIFERGFPLDFFIKDKNLVFISTNKCRFDAAGLLRHKFRITERL